jgi:hypothetical protein
MDASIHRREEFSPSLGQSIVSTSFQHFEFTNLKIIPYIRDLLRSRSLKPKHRLCESLYLGSVNNPPSSGEKCGQAERSRL